MADPKMSRDVPSPAEIAKDAAEREAAAPATPEVAAEISVQDRGDAIVSRASKALSGFLASMQTRMNTYATKAKKALSFGVGAAVIGAEGAVTHAQGLRKGLNEGLSGAAVGAAEIPGFIYDDIVKPVGEAMVDLVAPEAELSPAEKNVLADNDIRTLKVEKQLKAIDEKDTLNREPLIQELEGLAKTRDYILAKSRPRSLRGSASVAAAGRAAVKGAGMAAGGAATGVMMAGAGLATAGRWGANKAGEAAVGVKNSILDNVIDPAMEMGAEKKAKYLEAGAVMSEAFSKLAGKEVTLSEKQILALGATMDAGGFLKDIAEKGADTMAHMLLVEDGIDIARNLKQAGIDVVAFIKSPEDRAWLAKELKDFNIKSGEAIGEAASDVADALIVKPAQAFGRGAAAAGRGIAMGAMGGVALAGAGLGKVADGGKFVGQKAAEGLSAIYEGTKNTNEQLGDLAKQGASLFERMKKNVTEFMSTLNAAFNKIREPMITDVMAEEHPELAEGIPAAIKMLEDIDKTVDISQEATKKLIAGMEGSDIDPTGLPEESFLNQPPRAVPVRAASGRVVPVRRPAPKS